MVKEKNCNCVFKKAFFKKKSGIFLIKVKEIYGMPIVNEFFIQYTSCS